MDGLPTVAEILESDDLQRMKAVTEEVTESGREVSEALAKMDPSRGKVGFGESIVVGLPPRAKARLRIWARMWGVDLAQLLRLCTWRVGYALGYDVEAVLRPRDRDAVDRAEWARRPFDDKATADKKRSHPRSKLFTLEYVEEGERREPEELVEELDRKLREEP